MNLCSQCRCQLPPYDAERNLPFCQMPDHWAEDERERLMEAMKSSPVLAKAKATWE
jgi:hypothetical protein